MLAIIAISGVMPIPGIIPGIMPGIMPGIIAGIIPGPPTPRPIPLAMSVARTDCKLLPVAHDACMRVCVSIGPLERTLLRAVVAKQCQEPLPCLRAQFLPIATDAHRLALIQRVAVCTHYCLLRASHTCMVTSPPEKQSKHSEP